MIDGGSLHVEVLGCYDGATDATSSAVSIRSDDLSVVNLGPNCETLTVHDSTVNLLANVTAEQSYLMRNHIDQDEAVFVGTSFDITGNTFSGSTTRGLVTEGHGVVSDNTFTGNLGDGLLVSASDGPLEISGNRFEGNGFGGEAGLDGLRVEGAGGVIRVTGNQTRNNARYGINAESEFVVDGGGNTSTGDGAPEGCRGVVCGPG